MTGEPSPTSTGHATASTAPTDSIDARRLGLFVGVLLALVIGFTGLTWALEVDPLTVAPLYMFTPGIAGLAVCLAGGVSLSSVGLRVGNRRWLAVAIAFALLTLAVVAALSGVLPGVVLDLSPGVAAELGLPAGVLGVVGVLGFVLGIGVTINAVFALGEEFGWRGYLLWELAPLGFWKASLVIGTAWGLWHTPILVAGHNYPSYPLVGIVAMTVACVAMSPLYTYLVVRAKSVLAAAFLHGVFNTAGQLYGLYVVTNDVFLRELVASPVGVVGIVVFALVSLLIAVAGTPDLSREFAAPGRILPETEPDPGTVVDA